jgi:signal transduction histidine kinase
MARSNRVKDEFLSVMSHELRTPLTSLMGYMGMMQDKILGKLTREQETALEKMAGGSKALLTMIETIMEATKIETGAIVVERNAANLTEALESLRLTYDRSVGKEIALIWDYPDDLPTINTDAAKLKQILRHLINNAIKFTEKGHVTVSARIKEGNRQQAIDNGEQALGTRQQATEDSTRASRASTELAEVLSPHAFVEFKVADTGIGIPKEVIPLIFEKFRQVDSSETRVYGGVGLGLYIVKTFTELLGGKIAVQSDLGKGSTFTVTLPCQGERAASAKEKRLEA